VTRQETQPRLTSIFVPVTWVWKDLFVSKTGVVSDVDRVMPGPTHLRSQGDARLTRTHEVRSQSAGHLFGHSRYCLGCQYTKEEVLNFLPEAREV